MKAIDFLYIIRDLCLFNSVEQPRRGKVSNSELRRWFNNKAIIINGKIAKWDDDMEIYTDDKGELFYEELGEKDTRIRSKGYFKFGDKHMLCVKRFYYCKSLVLFPNSKKRKTTII